MKLIKTGVKTAKNQQKFLTYDSGCCFALKNFLILQRFFYEFLLGEKVKAISFKIIVRVAK